jgi:predicted ATPase
MARHPFDRRLPLRRVERAPEAAADETGWPGALPAVSQQLRDGLDLGPATVVVGDNGTGKSTLVEAIAMAYGLNAEGGSTHARHGTRASESPLAGWLSLEREAGASRWGYFLRAETMHGLYTYLETNPAHGGREARFHEMSHGESFLEVLRSRFDGSGFYVLDEPESALSFSGCLGLVGLLHDLMELGSAQILLATHSPVVAALPGAQILGLDDAGWHESTWEDLGLVDHHRRFLAGPERYLRHVLG